MDRRVLVYTPRHVSSTFLKVLDACIGVYSNTKPSGTLIDWFVGFAFYNEVVFSTGVFY